VVAATTTFVVGVAMTGSGVAQEMTASEVEEATIPSEVVAEMMISRVVEAATMYLAVRVTTGSVVALTCSTHYHISPACSAAVVEVC
jgi:predicted GNAT family acetyltransferase